MLYLEDYLESKYRPSQGYILYTYYAKFYGCRWKGGGGNGLLEKREIRCKKKI